MAEEQASSAIARRKRRKADTTATSLKTMPAHRHAPGLESTCHKNKKNLQP
jgi:hypothetical protein